MSPFKLIELLTVRLPDDIEKLEGAPLNATLTGPDSTRPVACEESKVMVSTPLGIITLVTLAKSGTAPPCQLAASNQFPEAPPIHDTEARGLIVLAVDGTKVIW